MYLQQKMELTVLVTFFSACFCSLKVNNCNKIPFKKVPGIISLAFALHISSWFCNDNDNSHASDVAKVKENLQEIEKLAYNASSEVEQISQYLRRDCLEITGIATNEDCSAEAIIKSIGDVIGVPLQDIRDL